MILRFACILVVTSAVAVLASGCRGERDAAELTRGGKAYLAQCALCHGPEGRGDGPLAYSIRADGKTPPAALDAARVASLGREGLRRAIEFQAHVRGGSSMPVWGPHLGAQWMNRIADYVVAMPATGEVGRTAVASYLAAAPGTPPPGRRVYVLYCSGCHGPQGGGDGFFSKEVESRLDLAPLRGASLSRLDDAELGRLVGLEGAHAPKAETMPGWLYTLSSDERQALLGYLRTLSGNVERD